MMQQKYNIEFILYYLRYCTKTTLQTPNRHIDINEIHTVLTKMQCLATQQITDFPESLAGKTKYSHIDVWIIR